MIRKEVGEENGGTYCVSEWNLMKFYFFIYVIKTLHIN